MEVGGQNKYFNLAFLRVEMQIQNLIKSYFGNREITYAEIGVCVGITAEAVLTECPNVVRAYLVDSYRIQSPEVYPEWINEPQSFYDNLLNVMMFRMSKFVGRWTLVRKLSMDALNDVPDVDVVYIDANHVEKYASQDIEAWSKKVKVGGLVSGHDYESKWPGVKLAVDKFVARNGVELKLVGDTVWYFVKQ